MHTTIINDCQDENAASRQMARAALLGGSGSFIGVDSAIQAAGNIIDILDAFEENPGVVLVNVAPRNGEAKKWQNGTPFGYFWHKKALVLASIDGLTLSLVKKYDLAESVTVLDTAEALDQLVADGLVPQERKNTIMRTQFRSFDFLPRIASCLVDGKQLQGTPLYPQDISDAPPAVWWVDNFGNCKTTLLPGDMEERSRIPSMLVDLPYFAGLKDVPDQTPALVPGSSGLGEDRFLEIVVQGGSAAKEFGLSAGDVIT